jgi:DNA polymerase III delta prime subunit
MAESATTDPSAPPKEPEKKPKKEEKTAEPEKLSLTKDELDALVEKAVEKERKKFDADKAKTKADADAEAAKKAGDFQKLYESEVELKKKAEADLTAAKLTLRREQVVNRMRAFVAKDHADYLSNVDEWMAPKLAIDAPELSDDDADKQIKDIVKKYVEANPRSAGVHGTTTGAVRGKAAGAPTDQPRPKPKAEQRTFSRWASSF